MNKCECWSGTLEKIKPKILEQVPGDALNVEINWKDYSYFMGGDYSPVNAIVKLEYRGLKKNKQPKANLTKKEMFLTFDYCPFCGRKYTKSDTETEKES